MKKLVLNHSFKMAFSVLGSVAVIAGLAPVQAYGRVPVTDTEWNNLAKDMIHEAELHRPVATKLFEILPEMNEILKADSQRNGMKLLWGTSLNIDEHAHAEIVNSEIISMLSQEAGVPLPDGEHVFAGIEHTYGYLFSTLNTAFGHKRLRWIQGELEDGLDLSKGTLGPFPQEGTLFGNATYLFGRIAFRTDKAVLNQLLTLNEGISKNLLNYSYDHLKPIRIIEEVKVDESRQIRLRTDLVPFLKKPATKGSTYLLIYSVEDSQNPAPQLITGFPVDDGMVKFLTAPESFGENISITTHYN